MFNIPVPLLLIPDTMEYSRVSASGTPIIVTFKYLAEFILGPELVGACWAALCQISPSYREQGSDLGPSKSSLRALNSIRINLSHGWRQKGEPALASSDLGCVRNPYGQIGVQALSSASPSTTPPAYITPTVPTTFPGFQYPKPIMNVTSS